MLAEVLEDGSSSEEWGHGNKDWIVPFLYSEFLMHYIFKIAEMVLVAYLIKKILFSLLPLDQNPQVMGPPVKFPSDLQGFIHQGWNVNHS